MGSVFFNKGENCIAAGRLFVEERIHDEFLRRVVAETKKMSIGDPLLRGTAHGPQNHEAHLNKLVEVCCCFPGLISRRRRKLRDQMWILASDVKVHHYVPSCAKVQPKSILMSCQSCTCIVLYNYNH